MPQNDRDKILNKKALLNRNLLHKAHREILRQSIYTDNSQYSQDTESEYEPDSDDDDSDMKDNVLPRKSIKRTREYEDSAEDRPTKVKKVTESDEITDSAASNLSPPAISIITWNIEKIGLSTHNLIAQNKSVAVAKILDQFHPMLLVMQEVSNANYLFDGADPANGRNIITGVKDVDLFEAHRRDILFSKTLETEIAGLAAQVAPANFMPGQDKINRKRAIDKNLIADAESLKREIDKNVKKLNEAKGFVLPEVTYLIGKSLKKNHQAVNKALKSLKNAEKTNAKKTSLNNFIKACTNLKNILEQIGKVLTTTVVPRSNDRLAAAKKIILAYRKRFADNLNLPEGMQPDDEQEDEMQIDGELTTEELLEIEREAGAGFDESEINITQGRYILAGEKYKLSDEYEILKGPQFIAGVELDATSDFYPVFYDKAAIKSKPELYTYDLKTEKIERLDYDAFEYTFRYGTVEPQQIEKTIEKNKKSIKELEQKANRSEEDENKLKVLKNSTDSLEQKKIAMTKITNRQTGKTTFEYGDYKGKMQNNRRLVLWKFTIPTSRYYLRITKKRETYGEWMDIFLGVVHTSPSIAIKPEIESILKGAKKLSSDTGIPILLGGDWYMEKEMKDSFDKLKKGEDEDWVLIAPGNNTNLPGKGKKGQIADHFLGAKGIFEKVITRSIPPMPFLNGFGNERDTIANFDPHDNADLFLWTNTIVDHTPVYSIVNIHLDGATAKDLEKNKKLNQGAYVADKTYSNIEGDTIAAYQEYVTMHVSTETIMQNGAMQVLNSGLNDYHRSSRAAINELFAIFPYYALALNTWNLTRDGQLFSVKPGDMAQVLLKKDLFVAVSGDNSYNNVEKKDPPDGIAITEERSCIFTYGITSGFGLILAYKQTSEDDNNGLMDDFGGTLPVSLTSKPYDEINETLDFSNLCIFDDTQLAADHFFGVIAINRLFIIENDDAQKIIYTILNRLRDSGFDPKKMTIYNGYPQKKSSLSIGIDANGYWGEVPDELPYL